MTHERTRSKTFLAFRSGSLSVNRNNRVMPIESGWRLTLQRQPWSFEGCYLIDDLSESRPSYQGLNPFCSHVDGLFKSRVDYRVVKAGWLVVRLFGRLPRVMIRTSIIVARAAFPGLKVACPRNADHRPRGLLTSSPCDDSGGNVVSRANLGSFCQTGTLRSEDGPSRNTSGISG